MLKKIFSVALLMFLLVVLLACGSGDNGDEASGGTKYLAENIIFSDGSTLASKILKEKNKKIFNFNIIPAAYAQSSDIDTETQIYAENVIFEVSSNSKIESDNVQDALEEITLTLSSVIEGTWNIENYHQEEFHDSTGKIVIYSDGTFDLVEGSFAAIGMGSGTAADGMCTHSEENQTYDIYTDELMSYTYINNFEGGSNENSVIPRIVKIRENEIIFIGSGGCGYAGRDRISVLTRVD